MGVAMMNPDLRRKIKVRIAPTSSSISSVTAVKATTSSRTLSGFAISASARKSSFC